MNVYRIQMLVLGIMTHVLAFGVSVYAQESQPTDLQRPSKPDCQSVMVVGAVLDPKRFELQRPTHLAELIALSGGLNDQAGKTVRVIHNGLTSVCSSTSESIQSSQSEIFESFDLAEVVRGEKRANPWMKAGDIVEVSFCDRVYVIGAVKTPQVVVLKDGLTLTRAVTLAGGPLKDSKLTRVRLLRVSVDAEPKVDLLILRELQSKPLVDPILRANDMIEVSDESGRFAHGSRLKGDLVVSRGDLPVTVVK